MNRVHGASDRKVCKKHRHGNCHDNRNREANHCGSNCSREGTLVLSVVKARWRLIPPLMVPHTYFRAYPREASNPAVLTGGIFLELNRGITHTTIRYPSSTPSTTAYSSGL